MTNGYIHPNGSYYEAEKNVTGAAGTNANLQPYIVVHMWKRTA